MSRAFCALHSHRLISHVSRCNDTWIVNESNNWDRKKLGNIPRFFHKPLTTFVMLLVMVVMSCNDSDDDDDDGFVDIFGILLFIGSLANGQVMITHSFISGPCIIFAYY